MHILLAGGAGFVGSHLAMRFLGHGNRVTIVDNFVTGRRENIEWLGSAAPAGALEVMNADVCRFESSDSKLDAVLHLASPASPPDYLRRPLETLESGSTGTRALLEIARRHGARFLFASTSEVYGDPLVHPQPENYWGNVNPVGVRSVYDEAKRFGEALTIAYGRHAGVVVRIARIFNTYGPRMRVDDGRVIPTFVTQAIRGEPLTVYGDGSQTRSYCYVDDLVDGLERLLWSDVERPVNLGSDEEYTVLETALRIVEACRSPSLIEHRDLPEDDPHVRRPDLGLARQRLSWHPRVSFASGLARTIEDIGRRLTAEQTDRTNGDEHARTAPVPWRRAPPLPTQAREEGRSGSAVRGSL